MTPACRRGSGRGRPSQYQDASTAVGDHGGVANQQLGDFLRTRRDRLLPQDVGLPAGPRRRTAGLRREEVAVLAHVSTEYYTRLEQGRSPRPSAEVCEAIAGALRLTDAETTYLFELAGTAQVGRRTHRRDVRPSIAALVHRLPGTAAFVMSAACEVLEWNPLAAALMEDFADRDPRERNLARKAFLAPQDAPPLYGIAAAAELRLSMCAQLRVAAARYPMDPIIGGLVRELIAGSADFARLWQRHDVQPAQVLTKTFEHPLVGCLTLSCDAAVLPDLDQQLVLYSAPPGSPAADALALLEVVGVPAEVSGRAARARR